MPLLSAIFSLFSRKIADLLQAIFGWSIAGLFGRLPSKKETGLAVALVLSLAWPVLVAGVFKPAVAAWAITFVPLHDFVAEHVLRWVWLGLAVVAPLTVAFITRWVAPPERKKGGVGAVLLSSIPLTIGFAAAFLVTLFVVPTLKLIAMARGRTDEHVYLRIDQGAYDEVLGAVRDAARTAGLSLDERPVPRAMAAPVKVLKWFGRGALAPLVAQDPKMLAGEALEIYLYPTDLMLRGKPALVARVRARLVTEMLNVPAHLVEEDAGQRIEDEIHRLWDEVEQAGGAGPLDPGMAARVRAVARRLRHADLPLDQWTLLHLNLSLLEHTVTGAPRLVDPVSPTPRGASRHQEIGKTATSVASV